MEKNETSLYFELINKTVNTIADELKDRPAVQRKVKSFKLKLLTNHILKY